MAKAVSMVSRLYGEVKKNGIANTYYKVKEKKRKIWHRRIMTANVLQHFRPKRSLLHSENDIL